MKARARSNGWSSPRARSAEARRPAWPSIALGYLPQHLTVLLWLLAGAACAGARQDATHASLPAVRSQSPERPAPKPERVPMIEADVGSLDEAAVKQSFAAAKQAIDRCFDQGSKRMSYLSGEIEPLVRIGKHGAVLYALAWRSTLGDRVTEQCILDALKQQSWPPPQGGREAEARVQLGTTARGRAAVELSPDALGAAGGKARDAIVRCHKSGVHVTAYLDTDGRPLAAGAAVSDPDGAGAIDCAIAAVMKLRFPSPGSWIGKIAIGQQGER